MKHYRALYRKIVRLPLDKSSLERLRKRARAQFSRRAPTYSVVDRKTYDKYSSVMDEILLRKYKLFPRLLDLVYKPLGHSEPWMQDFHHTKYSAFKRVWPQVHIIDDFGDKASISRYHQELKTPRDFSLMQELGLEDTKEALLPLPAESSLKPLQTLLDKYAEFHDFIAKNASKLLGIKIPPFEVLYEPNRYGLPESATIRESKLKKKVNNGKDLLKTFKPIQKSDLEHLCAFIESSQEINPNFYRSSVRQKHREDIEMSPLVKKYVQHKTLVPNKRNIKFYYRQYVEKQFFRNASGILELCSRNFYK